MNRRTSDRTREKGFTLVELLVVMSIMAVLAAVVVPAVTGINTTARNAAQPEDINQLQNAATRFNADSGSWPTKASTGASAGALPATTFTNTTTLYTFTKASIAGIALTSTYDSKTFVPDYTSTPKHGSDTVTVPTTNKTITISKQGVTNTVTLLNTTAAEETWDAWGIDSKGGVWSFITKDSY